MSEETMVETTEQPDVEAAEQLQEAVNGNEEAALQEGTEATEEPGSKTPEWVQRRFNEMTRARHEAERKEQEATNRANTYERLVESMRNGDQPQGQQPAQQQPARSDEDRIRAEAQKLNDVDRFNQRSNEVYASGTAEFKDFDNALKNLGMLGASPEFFQSIVDLDDSHKVLHALGSNPEEASRILSLPPLRQGRELERLASKSKVAAPKKPVSNAPAPISTLDGESGSAKVDLDKASIDDFMKARNSQSRKR